MKQNARDSMLGCFALDNIAKLVQHDDVVMTDACRKGDCINAHDTTKHVQLCMTTTCWLASQQVIWEPASSLHSVTVSVTAVLASMLICHKLVGC